MKTKYLIIAILLTLFSFSYILAQVSFFDIAVSEPVIALSSSRVPTKVQDTKPYSVPGQILDVSKLSNGEIVELIDRLKSKKLNIESELAKLDATQKEKEWELLKRLSHVRHQIFLADQKIRNLSELEDLLKVHIETPNPSGGR